MNPPFKIVLVAASIGAVATLSLYLADLRKDEPNNIELALRGGTPSDTARPPVSKTPKDAQLSDVPAESFTEGDGEQLAVDIRDGLGALKARMESSERTRVNRDAAFRKELDSLQSINADNAPPTLAYGPGGALRSVSGDFELSGGDQPAAIESFVATHKAVFGLGSLETPVVSRTQDSALGRVYHLDRTQDGYPVWGRQLVVSESNARVRSVTGKMQPLPPLDTRAELGETEALQIAQAAIADWSGTLVGYSAEKGIFVSGGKAHFAYRLDIASTANKGWHVYVSMNTKAVLSAIVKHYENTPSQGVDLLNVTRTFQSELASDGVTYVLKDPSFPTSTTGTGVGYDDPDSDNYLYVQSGEATSGWRPSAVSAIHNARATYDYFLETHGRNSFNANNESDTPLPLLAIVDVLEEDGSGLDNAYWYGGTMYYGKGSIFNNLAASLDVAAHEFGHGVVEYTAGLRYHNQSGALNESFADLFGAMVDRDDWLIGEDLYDNGAALRDMETPERGNQPSTFADYEHLPDTREGDWGGVHINSGIQNRAFYLMAEGLSSEGLGTSIGKERLEQIAYQALLRLGEDAEFIDAYLQMKLVAEDLYGEEAKAGVEAAWAAVGIAEATVPESDDVEVEFSLASGSDAIAYLFPRDGTFDYGEGDTYDIYAYYTDGASVRDDYIQDNDLGPINDFDAALIRPAMYSLELSDGSAAEIVVYVNTNGQLVLADALNAVDDQLVESERSINAAAMSPDGNRLVLVPSESRNIVSISLTSDDVDVFEALGPSYSDTDTDSPVQRVDAINFDYTGSKIAFDFLSCQPNLEGSECVPFWSIGVVDIDSGAFDYPFPGQDEFVDLGYPQFSNITNDVFVFDFLDYREGEAVDSLVLAYNRSTDIFSVVGSPDPDSIHGGIFSLPTVRGADTAVVYQYLTTIEGSDTLQPALYSAVINQDFEGQTSGSDFLFNFVGGFAESHRSGIQDLSADLLFSSDEVALGQVSGSELIAREISVKNTGTRDIEIASVAPSTNIRTNLTSTTVSAGETLTFSITIRPSDFDFGEASGSVAIGHDGDSGQKTILISATVVDAGETDGSSGNGNVDGDDSGDSDSDSGAGSDGGGGTSDDDAGSGNGTVDSVNMLDIDGDGMSAALSDGLLIIRHLFGFQGDSLIANALASGAEVTSASDIGAVIESRKTQLDVDEDGETKPLTDGLLIIRYLFGFQGQSLVSGAVGPGSDLLDSEIAANLQALVGDDAFGGADDGGAVDEGATDGSGTDGGTSDEGTTDDGGTDEGADDGTADAGSDDGSGSGGSTDSGAEDDGVSDAGSTDTGEDAGSTSGGSTDGNDGGSSSGGSTDDSGTDDGSGSTDGGSVDLVDIQLSVLYERVHPVIDTSSGFFSARLDYEGAELLPGRLLNVSVFDAETNVEFVPETPWQTDKSGQLTAELPIGRQFYFKVFAKTDVEGSDGTWSVSVHDNQGSSSIASYPVYVAISNSFETDQDRSITLTIESGWTGSGYTETRASGPFAIVDSIVEAMLKVGDSMKLTFRPLEVYWSPTNSTSNIGTSFYTQGTVFILGKEDEDTDEFDAHIIVHEWGHYFQDALSRDDSLGGPHGSGDILDPRVAFSEGWANALSGLVLGDPDYKDTAGANQNGGFYLPMEDGFPSSVVSITSGWFSEDSVGEIVTDLFDATNDAADSDDVSLALTEMTRALVGDVRDTPVATTIFSLVASVISENASQSSQIDSLLKHHDIALDGPATDVYGSNEAQVANGVTSNALPVFTEILIDGNPVRICQDKVHRDTRFTESRSGLGLMNKLGHRTLGRFTVLTAGNYRFSSSSGLQNGTGASTDPDVYIFSSGGYFERLEVEGPESQVLVLEPGEYWFEAYDWDYLTSPGGANPCQFVEITSQ